MRAPTVIIGVGGIGSDICARIEKSLPENAPDRDSFQFLIMDTDVNTIRTICKGGFRGSFIQLTDNITVKSCMCYLNEEKVKTWYPQSDIFENKAMTEGAGQHRSISRLAFDYAVYKGKLSELNRIIKKLSEIRIEESRQPMKFYIISSLAGGTGSGIILPLALYLNQYFLEEQGEALFSCKGFFLLSSAIRQLGSARLEQESVDSNAYAAVKELSAYMRIADFKEERYRNLYSRLKEENDIWDLTNSMDSGKIYEYCYLFGMSNHAGKNVHSFEDLKDMIANAVYMQACSPMQNMNSSLEDNTIKHLMRLAEMNGESYLWRFGGIGCGEVAYPYHKLKKCLAYQWAEDMMEDKWQAYDKTFYNRKHEQEIKRREGKKVESLNQGKEYIFAVDSLRDGKNDILATEIYNICRPENEEPLWTQYLDSLWQKIEMDINDYWDRQKGDPNTLIGRCEFKLDDLGSSLKGFFSRERMQYRNDALKLLRRLDGQMKKKVYDDAIFYAKTWFILHPAEGDMENYLLEHWLVRDGQFIHPNAVRYFLYNLQAAILDEQERIAKKESDKEGSVERLALDTDQDSKWNTRPICKESYVKYNEIYNDIFEWAKYGIYQIVLVKCLDYVKGLSEKYEAFYLSCPEMLERFQKESLEIEEELDRIQGLTISYVCADEASRKGLFKEIKDSPYYAQAGRGLSREIYKIVQNLLQEEENMDSICLKMEYYWIENLEQEFGDIINLDFVEAYQKEKWYKEKIHMKAENVKQWIKERQEVLIEPFLQYVGSRSHQQGISLFCYNSGIKHKSMMHREIIRWLEEQRGVADDYYCTPYQLMIYRSFVGLNISEVMEYRHKSVRDTPLGKGRAFRAYERTLVDMTQNIGAEEKEVLLTPHIDKLWHNYLEMPDANEQYQQEVELKIGVVFLYAVIQGKIRKNDQSDQNGEDKYLFTIDSRTVLKKSSYMECHLILYRSPELFNGLTREMIKDVKREIEQGKYEMLEKIKQWERGIFQILVDYNLQIGVDRQDAFLNDILLESLHILVALYSRKRKEDPQEDLEQYLSRNVWEKHQIPQEKKEAAKGISTKTDNYLKERDVERIHDLCTRLFFIEMQPLLV